MRPLALLALLTLGACAAATPEAPQRPAEAPSRAAPAAPTPAPAAPSVATPPPPSAAAAPEPAPFAPAAFAPPFARSAKPGDGQWARLPELSGRDADGALLRTTVHPHPIKKDVVVTLVAMDLARLSLTWVPGKEDPPNPNIPAEARPGLIPEALQPSALVVFNGGWLYKHGRHGMKLGELLFAPPKEGACTVALLPGPRLLIGPWERLEPQLGDALAWRQAPPCLLFEGAPHAELGRRNAPWGLSAEGKQDIRRSALGLDATGRVAYYALGEWISAPELTRGLQAAGVVTATSLDVNYSYTRFLFLSPKPEGPGLRISATLIEDTKHLRGEYTDRPAARDFFVVTRR